jgi:hypothetical protein
MQIVCQQNPFISLKKRAVIAVEEWVKIWALGGVRG